jgi:co-chaperonin GroES (HSP10)|tara:strand:- start:1208 stop:1462 length:255 start_codon:yes stop_codon:yes gene_type:complete
MEAVGNHIIVKEIKEAATKTTGGLELIERDREGNRYKKAIIISSGSESLKIDQSIIYDKVGSHPIEFGDEVYQVISMRDVVALL